MNLWILQISWVDLEGLGSFLHGSPGNKHWITLAWVVFGSAGLQLASAGLTLEEAPCYKMLFPLERPPFPSPPSKGARSEAPRRGNVIKITFPSWAQLNYQPLAPEQIYLFKTGGLYHSWEKIQTMIEMPSGHGWNISCSRNLSGVKSTCSHWRGIHTAGKRCDKRHGRDPQVRAKEYWKINLNCGYSPILQWG